MDAVVRHAIVSLNVPAIITGVAWETSGIVNGDNLELYLSLVGKEVKTS